MEGGGGAENGRQAVKGRRGRNSSLETLDSWCVVYYALEDTYSRQWKRDG